MKPCDLLSVDRALASFLEVVEPLRRTVSVRLEEADERVLARDVLAPMDYPHYDQCILDGYGVVAADTEGCGEGVERSLRLSATGPVESGVCVSAHTGSPLPPGADALLRLEGTAERGEHILVREAVTRGQWVWPKGGGIRQGAVVNREGMQLKPSDIAMLAKLGLFEVEVYDRPRVLVVPTGDECVKRGAPIGPGFVYEVNGLMCQLLVERYGGAATLHEIVPDCEARLRDALTSGTSHDLIVTIGGSSAEIGRAHV
jgi:molybdopterin molybdotransferase